MCIALPWFRILEFPVGLFYEFCANILACNGNGEAIWGLESLVLLDVNLCGR